MKDKYLNKVPSFTLSEKAVHVWSASAVESQPDLIKMSGSLSDDEMARAGNYRFDKDRSIYITARYALRVLSGRYLKKEPRHIVFGYTEYGKPFYKRAGNINFNLSHSGTQIAIAFSKLPDIGIDIEKIKYDFDTFELAKNFFAKEEIKALAQFVENERAKAFFRCWTRKESFIKAVGEGLSYPLDSFAVSMDDDERAEFLKIDGLDETWKKWNLYSFIPAEGYIAALSAYGDLNAVRFFDWDKDGR